MTAPKIVAFTEIVEKGSGWLHEMEFVLDDGPMWGHHLIVSDDTDEVNVRADVSEPLDYLIKEAAKLWAEFAFGCSHFPAKPVPEKLPRVSLRYTSIWHGSGVKFSRMA